MIMGPSKSMSFALWDFSSHSPVLHFVSFTLSPPLFHSQKNELWNERKEEAEKYKKITF